MANKQSRKSATKNAVELATATGCNQQADTWDGLRAEIAVLPHELDGFMKRKTTRTELNRFKDKVTLIETRLERLRAAENAAGN